MRKAPGSFGAERESRWAGQTPEHGAQPGGQGPLRFDPWTGRLQPPDPRAPWTEEPTNLDVPGAAQSSSFATSEAPTEPDPARLPWNVRSPQRGSALHPAQPLGRALLGTLAILLLLGAGVLAATGGLPGVNDHPPASAFQFPSVSHTPQDTVSNNNTPSPATATDTPPPTFAPTPPAYSMPIVGAPVPTRTATPRPTATATRSATPTAVATPRPTATVTPQPTATATPRPTPQPSPTATPQPSPTTTPAPTATASPSATPSPTAQPTPQPTPQPTAQPSPSPTVSPTISPTATQSPTPTTGTATPGT